MAEIPASDDGTSQGVNEELAPVPVEMIPSATGLEPKRIALIIASVLVAVIIGVIGFRWQGQSSPKATNQGMIPDDRSSTEATVSAEGASPASLVPPSVPDGMPASVPTQSLLQAYPDRYYSNADFPGGERQLRLSYQGQDGADIRVHVSDTTGRPVEHALCELFVNEPTGRVFLLRRATAADGICTFLRFQPSVSYQVNVFTYIGPGQSIAVTVAPKQVVDQSVVLKQPTSVAVDCSDSDGDDAYTTGTVLSGGKTYRDSCKGTSQVSEMYCHEKPGESGVWVVGQEDFDCPRGCSGAACIP